MKPYTIATAALLACSIFLTGCGKSDDGATLSQKAADQAATSGSFQPSSHRSY